MERKKERSFLSPKKAAVETREDETSLADFSLSLCRNERENQVVPKTFDADI